MSHVFLSFSVFDELSDLLDGPIFSQILSGALNFALSIYLMDMVNVEPLMKFFK